MKSKKVRTCRWCNAKINGVECCSNCATKYILVKDIKTMLNNAVKEVERKKKNREKYLTLYW